jgi:transcriptional regulator with XRE-family HTH domain
MNGEFGKFVETKRKGKGANGNDILLKDIALAMGISPPYLTDIVSGNRKPPAFPILEKMGDVLKLDKDERTEMYDIAARARNTVAPDILGYVMDKELPSVRRVIRAAQAKGLGEEFWLELLNKTAAR